MLFTVWMLPCKNSPAAAVAAAVVQILKLLQNSNVPLVLALFSSKD